MAALGASWLLNSGSAPLRIKCLFTLEVLIAHICLYIHEMDYVHQGDLVCFFCQHKECQMLTPGAHMWRSCSKWTGQDPLCWLSPGAGNQPEASGNFWVLQECRVISSTLTGLINARLSHTHPTSHKWELSLPSSPHTCTLTCKIFHERKI